MDTPDEFTGPVNIGNPDEFTILELAQKVVALTGSKSKIDFTALPSDDPTQRCPDIGLAREKLGWAPTITLEQGIKRTVAYFETILRDGGLPTSSRNQ
jgi:UDP-glucuronate decarboxylase